MLDDQSGERQMKLEISEYTVTLQDKRQVRIIRCLQKDDHYLWKILEHNDTLNLDGKWEYEPMSSNRTDEYLNNNRFSLEKAKELLLKSEVEKDK